MEARRVPKEARGSPWTSSWPVARAGRTTDVERRRCVRQSAPWPHVARKWGS